MRFSLRTAIFSLLLSTLLWFYISLQGQYEIVVPVPLVVRPPQGSSLESELPGSVSVKLRGSGWNLINALYLDRTIRIDLNLPSESESGILTHNDLRSAFRCAVPLQIVNIEPQRIKYRMGKIVQKKVPIESHLKLQPADGYVLARPVALVPDSVVVRGSASIVDTISRWSTVTAEYTNIKKSIVELIAMEEHPIVQVSPKRVIIKGEVQQLAEITYYDIPIRLEGELHGNYEIVPQHITVTLRGGIDDIVRLRERKVIPLRAFITREQIRVQRGVLLPNIEVPPWMEVSWEPHLLEVHHFK